MHTDLYICYTSSAKIPTTSFNKSLYTHFLKADLGHQVAKILMCPCILAHANLSLAYKPLQRQKHVTSIIIFHFNPVAVSAFG